MAKERKKLYRDKAFLRARQKASSQYMSQEEMEEKAQALRNEIESIEFDMASFISEGQMWIDIADADKRTQEQRMMSEIMQRRMLYACVNQLRGGFSATNICYAVGMYIGFAAINPEFREMTARFKGQALGAVLNNSAGYHDGVYTGKNPIMKRLAEKHKAYMAAANSGRTPFTPETAAVADIRMMKEAYEQMRDGKHDSDEVMERYWNARDTLSELMGRDGVELKDMAKAQRRILTYMAEKDPAYKQMCEEMDYSQWYKKEASPETIYIYDENNMPHAKTVHIWNGEYGRYTEDGYPLDVEEEACFTVREPMDEMDYAMKIMFIMDRHDSNYDFFNPDERIEAHADMEQAMRAAAGDKTAKAAANSDARKSIFENTRDELIHYKNMAKADWAHSDEKFEDKEFRAACMGVNGVIAKQTAMFLYSDADPERGTEFDSIDGQYAADISSLGVSFAEKVAGVDTESDEFKKKAAEVSQWYATAIMCMEAELPADFNDPKAKAALDEYLSSSPDIRKRYNDIIQASYNTLYAYSTAASNTIATGSSKEDAIKMLKYAENEGAKLWYNVHGEGIPVREKGLFEAREWADRQIDRMDFSDLDTDYAKATSNYDMNRRWRKAEAAFGDDNTKSDDLQYE